MIFPNGKFRTLLAPWKGGTFDKTENHKNERKKSLGHFARNPVDGNVKGISRSHFSLVRNISIETTIICLLESVRRNDEICFRSDETILGRSLE